MSGNVSNHIWVEDSTKPLGGYWARARGLSTGAALVSTAGAPSPVATVLVTFDAAADMPADITSSVNVSADRIKIDVAAISATCSRAQCIFHSEDGQTTCIGAVITVNAADDNTANSNLTQTDVTGGSTASAGKSDTVVISQSKPEVEFKTSSVITRIDLIGIPGRAVSGKAYVEVRLIG